MGAAVLVALVIVVAVTSAVAWWQRSSAFESTDDAFIDGPIIPISSKVSGKIGQVFVHENQQVKENDLLVKLDPRDYEAAVQQRQAALEVAQARETSAKSSVDAAKLHINTLRMVGESVRASVAAARSQATMSEQDHARNETLLKKGALALQDLQHSTAANLSDTAKLESTKKEAEAANAYLDEATAQEASSEAQLIAAEASVRAAQADLDTAKLQLSYTEVRAPMDGRVTKKAVEPGAYTQIAQTLFSLVPQDVWVTANFKETQLKDMQPNQPVEIEVDAFERTLKGHVDSVMAGSGARFSLLPPENATGNFVKVVQRVPVKILFDQKPPFLLGPGMSVTPTVRVRGTEGAWVWIVGAAAVSSLLAFVFVGRAMRA